MFFHIMLQILAIQYLQASLVSSTKILLPTPIHPHAAAGYYYGKGMG